MAGLAAGFVEDPPPSASAGFVEDAPAAPETAPPDDRGVLAKAWDDISSVPGRVKANLVEAGQSIGSTAKKAFTHPIERLKEIPGEVAGVVKGAGHIANNAVDAATLGYFKTGRDFVGNKIAPEATAANRSEEERFRAENPFLAGTGDAIGTVAGPVNKLAGTVAEKAVSPLASAFEKAIGGKLVSAASKVPLVGSALAPVAEGIGGAAKGIAGFEATAPAISAASAGAEGHRLEAAEAASTDPTGLILSGAPPALAAYLKTPGVAQKIVDRVMSSKGAEARKFIEQNGQGAEVTIGSAGKGGVFDDRLAGVPASDRGVGIAAKRGAKEVADAIERQFEEDHGFGYREAPKEIKDAIAKFRDSAEEAKAGKQAASGAYKEQLASAKSAVKETTAAKAKDILSTIEEDHRVETSRPYKVLKEQIDNSPAASKPRDVTELVTHMQNAVHDLETAPFVRGALTDELKLLERYRDPQSEVVMVPERQVNGLRRSLMRSAKIGMSDAPGEAEAPLRKAAFLAKQMVDEGPYEALNRLYAEGSAKREAARKAVGLGGKPARDRALDEKRLTANLRRSILDPTAIPGAVPEDVAAARRVLELPEEQRQATLAKIAEDLQGAKTAKAERLGAIGEATKGAEGDRALLGLNAKIGTRKTDVNQIRLALERQVSNSNTGGGNPADLEGFRAAHPEHVTSLDLPKLQNAKNDLTFSIVPRHGGPLARAGEAYAPLHIGHEFFKHPIATTAGVAIHNAKPIQGRLLVPGARAYEQVVARLVHAAGSGGDVSGAIQHAIASGIPPRVARRIADISRQTFAGQSQDATADATTGAIP